jgi:hypothetical protein
MLYKIAPLSASFMLTSILGVFLSVVVSNHYPSLGFSFFLIFVLMFIASIVSMTLAPLDAEIDIMKKSK